MCASSCYDELNDQDADVDKEYDPDYLYEDCQDGKDLSDISHVKEDSEYVEGEKRYYRSSDGLDDNLFKIMECILECLPFVQGGKSQSKHEGKDKCCHHIHQRRNGYRKERLRLSSSFNACK